LPVNSNIKLRELTSCLCSAAASAVCFEARVAGLDKTETGNELSQPGSHHLAKFIVASTASEAKSCSLRFQWVHPVEGALALEPVNPENWRMQLCPNG